MRHKESQVGTALTHRLRVRHPREALLWVHMPNGAFLAGTPAHRARQMKRLKAEGVQPGWPDYMLMIPRQPYHGLALELKIEGNKPTIIQMKFLDELNSFGYCAKWASGLDEAWEIVDGYLRLKPW